MDSAMNSQKQFKPRYSFEFFPPKTPAGMEKLQTVRDELARRKPDFFSVTYGAGGSTQTRTIDTVLKLQDQGISTAPHLSCVGSTLDNMKSLLDMYLENGVNRIVALRGDLPSGMGSTGELRYANELVEFIRKHSGDHFNIEVAAYPEFHPQAPSAEADLLNFKKKVDAGANSAITQYFYNADAYLYFVERAEKMGIHIPIVPGIMPITNYSSLVRFSDMCGAEIPRWIKKQLEAYGDDSASIIAFGEQVVTQMCERLLAAGAPGLHFYTLNQAEPNLKIWDNLGLSDEEKIRF
jgi:methylenetetrahydrofolate reductase (NADPH)